MGWSISPETRAFALMYHDVVSGAGWGSSGFSGAAADLYKVGLESFRDHLDAIAHAAGDSVSSVENVRGTAERRPVFLTFDDGGASAYTLVAEELERRGWRGHFFIPTGYIGRPGFLQPRQILALRRQGHVVGSHTCSHPRRISGCTPDEMLREWAESVRILSEILGERVTVASVPGGFYSQAVARSAAQAGIRLLFNSEPTCKPHTVGDCVVLGRYFVQRNTPAATAAAFAGAAVIPRLRQGLLWHAKKLAKTGGGAAWFRFRQWALDRNPAPSGAPRPEERTGERRSRAA